MSPERKVYWARRTVLPAAIVSHRLVSYARRVRATLFHQRAAAITWLSREPAAAPRRDRVLAVVAHVTAPIAGYEPRSLGMKVERVRQTVDGLLSSFAHCNLDVVLLTYRDQHVLDRLPTYQGRRVRVVAHDDGDPMFVEFRAQDLFFDARDQYDWFLMLEDDIVIRDSTFLDKLSRFNIAVADDGVVLVPNRYEYTAGVKTYIDLFDRRKGRDFAWDMQAGRTVDGVTFAECANPHAGMYCLNRRQLDRWDRSGRHWYDQVSFVGPLESAATGCLYECFVLYKPAPTNPHFCEVEHLDGKYSRAIADLRGETRVTSEGFGPTPTSPDSSAEGGA